MISVAEAKNIVTGKVMKLSSDTVRIDTAVGYVLAKALYSPVTVPAFRQSSMDGYAVRDADWSQNLIIQDELPAGSSKQLQLLPNHTIRVFTGGMVPDEADTVIPKELVTVSGNTISVNIKQMETGANIRNRGSEINAADLAFPAGITITPMHIGYLASLGITTVPVIKKPSIAIIITGNELVQPGKPLETGQVYESNSFALTACLRALHIDQVDVFYAKDNQVETEEKIQEALTDHDLILLTGGVSVGDYDFVAAACGKMGVKQAFHGVKQKPGKPLFFGTMGNKLVFGLPGNPASVLSCFYQYVRSAIHLMAGMPQPLAEQSILAESFEKKPLLTFFLKGILENGKVTIAGAQASYQQSAFTEANCWIELPEEKSFFEKGDAVTVYRFL